MTTEDELKIRLREYELANKLAIAVQALRDCVDPITRLRRDMKADQQLNGHFAVRYAESPETYKSIARDALFEIGEKS